MHIFSSIHEDVNANIVCKDLIIVLDDVPYQCSS